MKWLFILLSILGSMCLLATIGANNPKQRKQYLIWTIMIWVIMFILINTIGR